MKKGTTEQMPTNTNTLKSSKGLSFVTRNSPINRGRRAEGDFDFYPTPPWATRALFESGFKLGKDETVWEPACGMGHMEDTIKEYHPPQNVVGTDLIHGQDFFKTNIEADWLITNPPFDIINSFTLHALEKAKRGVAMFVRYPFLETQGRYNTIFSKYHPTSIYQFYQRVKLNRDHVSRSGPSAVVYVWVVWDKKHEGPCTFQYVTKTQAELEKESDYE